MQTIETQVTLRKLKADEGKYLVQAGADIPKEHLLPTAEVTLGQGDAPENWREIDAAEAAEIEAARAAAARSAATRHNPKADETNN